MFTTRLTQDQHITGTWECTRIHYQMFISAGCHWPQAGHFFSWRCCTSCSCSVRLHVRDESSFVIFLSEADTLVWVFACLHSLFLFFYRSDRALVRLNLAFGIFDICIRHIRYTQLKLKKKYPMPTQCPADTPHTTGFQQSFYSVGLEWQDYPPIPS